MDSVHRRHYSRWLDLVNFIGVVAFVSVGGWIGDTISPNRWIYFACALGMGLCWIPVFDVIRHVATAQKRRKTE
jgi:hypothetical protein